MHAPQSFRSSRQLPAPLPPPDDSAERLVFRIWIARFAQWTPSRWNDVPPRAIALEPVSGEFFSEEDARLIVEGFNSQMLSDGRRLWAVALAVWLRLDGDPQPGDAVQGYVFECPAASFPDG